VTWPTGAKGRARVRTAGGGTNRHGWHAEVHGPAIARRSELARGKAADRAAAIVNRPWHVAMAALAAGLGLATAPALIAPVAACLAGLASAAARAPALGGLAAAALLAGSTAGGARLAALDAAGERIRDGEQVELRAHLLTRPRPSAFGSSAEARVAGGRLAGTRVLLRIPRWTRFPGGVEIGAELGLEGQLATLDRPVSPAGSGAASADPAASAEPHSHFVAHLRRRDIAAELLLDRARLTGRRRGGLAGVLDRMRERAERAVAAGLSAEDAALLRGMVLGQDEAIGEGTREDFRASGLSHLLAVSGQNVMLLAALALPALRLSGLGPRARLGALALLIALYVPLAGAGPSLQRAGVMGLAGIAAMAASRPSSRWYALLLAAAATLALNPRAAGDPGWQLSFAAVAGILTLGVPLQRTLRRAADEVVPPGEAARYRERTLWRAVAERRPSREAAWRPGRTPARPLSALPRAALRALADGIAITVAATLATGPLLAHHFGSVPLAGLPANLLALPAVAPLMWLGMLKTAGGQLAALGPASEAAMEPAVEALGAVAALPAGFLVWTAERFADLPGGQVSLPADSIWAVAGAYVLAAAAPLAMRRVGRRLEGIALERAAGWRRLPRGARAAIVAALTAGAALGSAAVLAPPVSPEHLTVRFLDVGQGDATLIQHPGGAAVLFDGGPPEAGVARLLRRAGVRRLALVVATHASRDHHGGLLEVLRRYRVGVLLDGGDGSRDPTFRSVLAEAHAGDVRIMPAIAPLTLELGGLHIHVMSPPPRPPGPAPEDPNPRAVVAVVRAGDFDLLLSADAESETLLALDLPDVDAMKVPHHGSADAGLPEVLDRLEPELAAIEVGPNTYGHPAPSTLAALGRAGVTTHRTDEDGTVTLSIESNEMRVSTER